MQKSTIYISGDHAAFELKARIVKYLEGLEYKVNDFGPFKFDPEDDYPDFVIPAARAAVRDKNSLAIVLCGTGIGACIAANKVKGARAALVYDVYTARMSRQHNDSNVLCLGALTTGKNFALIKCIIKTWLENPFSTASRHTRRLKKIEKYEK